MAVSQHKHFKIAAALGLVPLVPDTMTYVLVAQDGDTYLVARSRQSEPWPLDAHVHIPMVLIPLPMHGCDEWVPQWHRVKVVQAHRYSLLRPADVVGKLYSDRVGCQLLPHRCPDDPYDEECRLGIDVPFDPAQFVDSSMMAAVKAWTANNFVRFATNGFRRSDFDPFIYIALGNSFGMGPMTRISRFYQRWFGTTTQQLIFCQKVAEYPVAGDPTESNCDLERAIQYVVIRYVLRAVAGRSATARSTLERRLLIRLLRRHGMPSLLKPWNHCPQ